MDCRAVAREASDATRCERFNSRLQGDFAYEPVRVPVETRLAF